MNVHKYGEAKESDSDNGSKGELAGLSSLFNIGRFKFWLEAVPWKEWLYNSRKLIIECSFIAEYRHLLVYVEKYTGTEYQKFKISETLVHTCVAPLVILILRYTILPFYPLQAPKMANFHSDGIVSGAGAEVCEIVTFQCLFIQHAMMVYHAPRFQLPRACSPLSLYLLLVRPWYVER